MLIVNNNFNGGTSANWYVFYHVTSNWKLEMLVSYEGRKPNRSSRGKTSGSKEPKPNSTLYIWRRWHRLSALTSTPCLHPTPHSPPHSAWWDPGAKFQIKTSGHHILREWWMIPHSLFTRFAHDGATLCLRNYLSSSVMLSQDLSFSHWVQGLSIWPSLSNTYKINKQSSWLTVLAAY